MRRFSGAAAPFRRSAPERRSIELRNAIWYFSRRLKPAPGGSLAPGGAASG
jgi:hypothetical protein